MPIDLQCPDCEHTFRVPSSMAGRRTLCRGCNAALIVPESSADDEPEESFPPRSRRTVEEKPPNWDTPIPFRSPVPIVGVLLIALAASVLILGIYAIAREPGVASKPAPFTGNYSYATQPVAATIPAPGAAEGRPTAYDREVILPDRELILPRSASESTFVTNLALPQNWSVVRQINRWGDRPTFRAIECATGRVAGSIPVHPNGVADGFVGVAPSGRWFTQIADADSTFPTIGLHAVSESGPAVLKWAPYAAPSRGIKACVIVSDRRILTVSGDGAFDLWAIPSGDFLRRVAVASDCEIAETPAFDVSTEKALLALRSGAKIEVHPLGDDDFGAQWEFEPTAASGRGGLQFTPDGKKLVAVAPADNGGDRVELYDIDRKRKSGEWMLKSERGARDPFAWRAGAETFIVHLPNTGSVTAYGLTDGKVRSVLVAGAGRQNVQIERTGERVWIVGVEEVARGEESPPGRLYGFDLPLRAPATIRKDPVWEYRAGVLELKKAGR